MSARTLSSLLGLALIAVAIAGWVYLPNRSEWVVGGLLAFGGFLVSKSATAELGKTVVALIRAWRAPVVLLALLLIPACEYPTEPIVNVQCVAGDSVVITDTLITGCVDPRDLPFDSLPELP